MFASYSCLPPKICRFPNYLTSDSARQLPIADQIIVLGTDGKLNLTASFQSLKALGGYVHSLAIQQHFTDPDKPIVTSHKEEETTEKQPAPKKKEQEKRSLGTRDKSVYSFYLRPIGFFKIGVLLVAVISLAFLGRFQRIWVQWWTEAHGHQWMYIGGFFSLGIGACLSFAFFFW